MDTEYLWITASLVLVIGWIYVKDSIRTDEKSGDMDVFTGTIAFIGIAIIYRFLNKMFMKNANIKTPKYRV
jgi:hypothetical protein